MTNKPLLSVALLSIALFCTVLLASGARAQESSADIAGTWSGKTEVPDHGLDQVTLVLTKAESGGYSGTISDSLGNVTAGTEIKDVTWADNVLTFAFMTSDGTNVRITARFEDGKLSGTWEHEGGTTGSIVFERGGAGSLAAVR